jgi:D-arabinan exo alpha-(1,3)/(1,5)-arabinofuranosidase (non-reducing end)
VINFSAPDNTLEGDPHIYLDDSKTPQIAVTGTEEWGLGGNYWNGGQQVSLPSGGLPSSINNPPGTNIDGAALYRFLLADSIPFNRHLVVRWEHGGSDESTHPYRATMLWYGTPAQTALSSDSVVPVVPASRLAHHYTAAGEQIFQRSAAYEYTVHAPLMTASGTTLTGAADFTVQLDQRNTGAFLRRTFDDCLANQRAQVYLDGRFAGTWYDAGASQGIDIDGHQRCWRDEDFPLPAALTAGKSLVRMRIVFLPTTDPPDSAWTALRYTMYSFVINGK